MGSRNVWGSCGAALAFETLVLVASGCSPARSPAVLPTGYGERVEPIVRMSCAACHLDGFANGGLALDLGTRVLVDIPSRAGMAYVTPGDPDASYLWHKLVGDQADVGGGGARMPIGIPLAAQEMAIVEEWILAGAEP